MTNQDLEGHHKHECLHLKAIDLEPNCTVSLSSWVFLIGQDCLLCYLSNLSALG